MFFCKFFLYIRIYFLYYCEAIFKTKYNTCCKINKEIIGIFCECHLNLNTSLAIIFSLLNCHLEPSLWNIFLSFKLFLHHRWTVVELRLFVKVTKLISIVYSFKCCKLIFLAVKCANTMHREAETANIKARWQVIDGLRVDQQQNELYYH